MEHSRQQATPQAAGNTTATVSRGQQMASQVTVAQHTAAPGYCGPQPGQRAAGLTTGGSRQKRAPSQVVAGSKQAKVRQNMAGVETGGSRVEKSRRTSDLSVERLELGHVLVGAALQQVDTAMGQYSEYER